MYVHIGDNVSIPMGDIITMVHAKGDELKKSPIAHYDGEIIYMVEPEDVKTYIITDDVVYASGISLKTLQKRIVEFYGLLHPRQW